MGKARMKRRTWRRRALKALLCLVALTAISISVGYVWISRGLPSVANMTAIVPPPEVEVRANDGGVIARYGGARGAPLTYDEIPTAMIQAVVAIEDRRFFIHGGVDIKGIARALWFDIANQRFAQGGSTITQQLAKRLYLSSERTLMRKLKEVILARRLEANYTKETILTTYLNQVYFGAGAYGLQAAARTYFNRPAAQLSVSEAAMLAGLLKAPSRIAPTRDPDAAWTRAKLVIDAMADERYLTAAEARTAHEQRPVIANSMTSGARYFTDWVMARLAAIEKQGGFSRDDRSLVVHTSFAAPLQRAMSRAINQVLDSDQDPPQAAGVLLAPDGAVLAMMGGRNYQASSFNRATASLRQPGSAFKIFVYGAALEAGATPFEMIDARPVSIGAWAPANVSSSPNRLPMIDAFAKSVNTAAVRLSEGVGRDAVQAFARSLGISSKMTPHASLALGTSEVRPLELTAAFASVMRGGRRVAPYAIVEIQASDGEVVYRFRPESGPPVMKPTTARALHDLLQKAAQSGTGRAAAFRDDVAGKTGTTQRSQDTWFVGYTRDAVGGVWIGHDEPRAMDDAGGRRPARIWRQMMMAVPPAKTG